MTYFSCSSCRFHNLLYVVWDFVPENKNKENPVNYWFCKSIQIKTMKKLNHERLRGCNFTNLIRSQ